MNNQGQNEGTSNNHANTQDVEQQSSPAGPTIYVPNPELKAVIETRVQIALERQQSGLPLRIEDVMALDYEDTLRHLNQQNHTQNEQERQRQQHQQQQQQPRQLTQLDIELQLHIQQQRRRQQEQQEQRRRQQRPRRSLKNCRIWREAEIIHNLGRENFEPINKENAENTEQCSICLVNYNIGEEIGRLDCAHKFHMKCIKEWLLLKNKCPLCNRMGLYLE